MLCEQSSNHLNVIRNINDRLNRIEFKSMPEYKLLY